MAYTVTGLRRFAAFPKSRRPEHQVLRIAIAGCGWAAATLHAPAIRRSGAGGIVAVSDPREGARRSLGAVPGFTDWRAMLAETDCDEPCGTVDAGGADGASGELMLQAAT